MGETIKNREFGVGGVNLVIDPLKLQLSEATQLQNAELLPDEAIGGALALKQRAGFQALNGSAMSGSVIGGIGWPLRTSYTRTLYAPRQTEDANTWKTSTNGTVWADTATPAASAIDSKYADENDKRDARRIVAFRTYLLYPGNGYTQDTDNPIVVVWDGVSSVTVTGIPKPGSAANAGALAPQYVITDMLVAEGNLYLATHEPGGVAPDHAGQVMQLNLDTGVLRQIATAFSAFSLERTGGAPSCMAFYKGQLFVGLNGGSTTDAIGTVVRCYPSIDTLWTVDVSNLSGHVSSLAVFRGKLYAGTQSSVATAEKIYERSPTAGTWAAVFTGVGAGANGHVASLFVFDSALYGVQYHETAPTIHIKRSADGTTWATDRDVDGSDSGVVGNFPGQMAILNSGLYVVFRSTTVSAVDGFIMQRAAGAWTKVNTDNFGGPISVLVQKAA